MAVIYNANWYLPPNQKRLGDVTNTAIPEQPNVKFHKEDDHKAAANSLYAQLNANQPLDARGKRKINMNSPDESLMYFLRKSGKQLTPLQARVVHALTDSTRDNFDPEKVVTAGNAVQTLKQADFVASVPSNIPGRDGHPDIAFAKAYLDPSCPSGTRWHVVIVDEALNFITQYSKPDDLQGRVRNGLIIGVGKYAAP